MGSIIAGIALVAALVFIFWWMDYCDRLGVEAARRRIAAGNLAG